MSTKEDLLLAEIADLREQLYRAENPEFNGRLDSWQAACGKARGESESLRNELRELKTENESLRKDAARYQWIRDVICIDHLHDTVIAAYNAEEYDFCIDQDMTRD